MNAAVELSQYKAMYEKLKICTDSKTAEIRRLRKAIQKYENGYRNKIPSTEDADPENVIDEVNKVIRFQFYPIYRHGRFI